MISDDDLRAMRARSEAHKADEGTLFDRVSLYRQLGIDLPRCIAEIEQLRAENERLRAQLDPESIQHWDSMRAERDQLRAENERLRGLK